MTQIAPGLHDPSFLVIEDRLDVIGQKYRVQRIVRGAALWVAFALATTLAAAAAAHWIGAGAWTRVVLVAWVGWLAASAVLWIVRPLLIRPDPVAVARLVESKVEGLHNGLTNALLLARAGDLSQSPWLPQIFEEVLRGTDARPLGEAVRMSDLKPLGIRLAVLVGVSLVVLALFRTPLAHGWRQLSRRRRSSRKSGR